MPARIVTNLVEDQPKVLLIAYASPVSQWLQTLLEQQHLDVVQLSPEDLQREIELGNTFADLYKIVWLFQITSVSNHAQNIIQWLTTKTQSTVVLTAFTSPINDDRLMYKEWSNQSKTEQLAVEVLQAQLPSATILIGQDVFFSPSTFLPLKSLLFFLEEHSLVDPNVLFTLQTARSFCQAVLPNMMSPLAHRVVVQGKKVTSGELVKKIQLEYQRSRGVLPTIELLTTEVIKTSGLPTVTNPELEPLSSFVKDIPRSFALSKTKKTKPTSRESFALPAPNSSLEKIDVEVGAVPNLTFSARETVLSHLPTPLDPTEQERPPSMTQGDGSSPLLVAQEPPSEPESNIAIEEQVVQLFDKYRSDHKVQRVEKLANNTATTVRKQTRKKKLFWAGMAFVGCGLGVAALVVGYWATQFGLQTALVSTLENTQTATLRKPLIARALPTLANLVQWQTLSYGAIFDQAFFDHPQQLVQVAQSVTELETTTQALEPMVVAGVTQFLGGNGGSSFDQLDQALNQAKLVYEKVAETQAAVKTLDSEQLGEKNQNLVKQFDQQLTQRKKSLLPSQYLQPLLPNLLGINSQRVYAVVLQNNQELRPTGGFIQAVALVTVSDGVIFNVQVKSVYDWDKQVLGAVAPPGEVVRFLGETQWFLRDSNWSPDFPTTTNQIASFLGRATNGQKIDGVIALNLISLREILRVLGPLDLPEYNEVITDKNLAERMEFHSEIQLVPGSTQDYSTLILIKSLEKIRQLPSQKTTELLTALQESFDSSQLQLSLTDPAENSSLTTLGWTGALLHPACPSQLADASCHVDVVAQVESNVGVNKANKYISRKIEHVVSVSRQAFQHRRKTTYTNTATSPAWPKGTYKNYLRLYVTAGSQLESISINNTPVTNDQIIIRDELDRRVFGVLVEVPINQTVVVETIYSVPHSNTGPFSYAFFDQRQSGIEDPQLQVVFEQDMSLRPVVIAPQAEVKNQSIRFAPSLLSHTFVGAQFN